jgi:UrcA family protein
LRALGGSKEELMMTTRPFFTLLSLFALAAPVAAQRVDAGAERAVIQLNHVDRHPTTPAAARRSLARIDRAALEVCGAFDSSFRELKDAVHRSDCWRESMAGAVAQIDDPLLRAAYADRPAAMAHRDSGG